MCYVNMRFKSCDHSHSMRLVIEGRRASQPKAKVNINDAYDATNDQDDDDNKLVCYFVKSVGTIHSKLLFKMY